MLRSTRAILVVGAASAGCAAAMLRYPGGTSLDHDTRGYSLSHNFLSDLGMTVAYNGQANRLGAACFVVAMLTLVFGGIGAIVPRLREIAGVHAARPWMRAVAICLLVAAISFTGVAFTPENRAMQLHVDFTVWGWRVVALVSLLLGVAARRAGEAYRSVAAIGLATGAILVAYAATMVWGPTCCATDASLVFHVVAQKCAVVVVVAALAGMSTGLPAPSTASVK